MSEGKAPNRLAGLVVLLLGVGAAGAGVYLARQAKPGGVAPEALAAAVKTLNAQAQPAMETAAKTLEPVAAEAARVPELAAAFDNGVDAVTFQDLFESEEWWKPYRQDGRSTALISNGKVVASLFVERSAPPADAILARLASSRVGSGFLKGDGRLYVAAAARVEQSKKAAAASATVLVARPFDPAALATLATQNGFAMGVADGQRLLLAAGPTTAQQGLGALVGRERATPLLTPEGHAATASELAPGLWLWSVGAAALPVATADVTKPYAISGLGVVLILLGLVLFARKSNSAGNAPAASTTGQSERPRGTVLLGSTPAPGAGSGTRPAPAVAGSTTAGISAAGPHAATALAMAAESDRMLGRYTLVEKIGEGGMAEVFRATLHGAEGFERQLVIKRLHPHLAAHKDAVAQFIDEAQLQSALAHPNIVPVFDFGTAGQDYFLALEYIHGRDLEKLLHRHVAALGRPLDIPLASHLVNELLTALAYAHTKRDKDGRPLDLVHRDVSLGNVLVSFDGEVKLSDFGVVKAGRRVSKTQVGMVKGNAGFMAPEQARGEPVDARSDVFAAGVVLYCLLTSQPLYHGDTTLNQLLRAAMGPSPTQLDAIQALSPPLAAVLGKALAMDPNGRYASAADFARALRPFGTSTREEVAQVMRTLFADDLARAEVRHTPSA